jgi:hypothetical protein
MTETCTYKRQSEPRCSRLATDNVIGSGRGDDWHVIRLDTYTPEFCEPHAKTVADERNERWRQARALLGQGRKKSAKLRCKVCDEVLAGLGEEVPGVGRCCAGCVTLAQGEMVQDEQAAGPPKKKRGRRVAAVIG